jgi:uncharacterized protein YdeI (BOF family)
VTRLPAFIGFIAVALLIGCTERAERTLGTAFDGTPISIAAARITNAATRVVLRGTMTEKCPVAGCWFILRDESGLIKVDTKNAGFAVVDVPLRSSLLVAGQVVTNGTERAIDATGVRY